MLARWVTAALHHSGLSGAELARRLTTVLGRSIDRAAVQKMQMTKATAKTKPRAIAADEAFAISAITKYPLPASFLAHAAPDRSSEDIAAEDGVRHVDDLEVATSLDHDPDQIDPTKRPFDFAVPQISGRMGGGSTGEIITLNVGEMRTIEPVAAWWRVPPPALRMLGVPSERLAAWPMDGDSMEPTILRTDIVFIDTGRQKVEPDGIWAVDYGEGRTLKRISSETIDGRKVLVLTSDNPKYTPKRYAPEEVTIFGRYLFRFTVY